MDADQCAGEEGPFPAARAQCHPELSPRCLPGPQPQGEDLKLKMVSDGGLVERLPDDPWKKRTAGPLAVTAEDRMRARLPDYSEPRCLFSFVA